MYVQDAFKVQKGHVKCTIAQFDLAMCRYQKNILDNKSLFRLITGANFLKED